MARWKGLDDAELDSRIIYTGAYGFEFNDALGRVWGRTPKQWESAMRYTIAEVARLYASEEESERQIRNQLWYVGPFALTVGEVIADMEDAFRADDLRDDIRAFPGGCVY